ncbi:hypothetical protein FOZ61_001699, partial [Perkinsus olseni]
VRTVFTGQLEEDDEVGKKTSHNMRRTGVRLLADAMVRLEAIADYARWTEGVTAADLFGDYVMDEFHYVDKLSKMLRDFEVLSSTAYDEVGGSVGQEDVLACSGYDVEGDADQGFDIGLQ